MKRRVKIPAPLPLFLTFATWRGVLERTKGDRRPKPTKVIPPKGKHV
jgi:hypothetical protein